MQTGAVDSIRPESSPTIGSATEANPPGWPGRPVPAEWNRSVCLCPGALSSRLDNCPSSAGIDPASSFLCRFRNLRLASWANSAGIVPVRLLPPRSSRSRLVICPRTVGIDSDNSLFPRFNTSRLGSEASSSGTDPDISLAPRSRILSSSNWERLTGMAPDTWLSARSSSLSRARLTRFPGNLPDRLFDRSSSRITLPLASVVTPCHSVRGSSLSQFSLSFQFGPSNAW